VLSCLLQRDWLVNVTEVTDRSRPNTPPSTFVHKWDSRSAECPHGGAGRREGERWNAGIGWEFLRAHSALNPGRPTLIIARAATRPQA
jgi:hypothetical protein